MSITKKDVEKLAHLSRLTLADSSDISAESITHDLNNILALIAKINAIDTKNIMPMAHPHETQTTLRPDIITEKNIVDLLDSLAPPNTARENLFTVPLVVE